MTHLQNGNYMSCMTPINMKNYVKLCKNYVNFQVNKRKFYKSVHTSMIWNPTTVNNIIFINYIRKN